MASFFVSRETLLYFESASNGGTVAKWQIIMYTTISAVTAEMRR